MASTRNEWQLPYGCRLHSITFGNCLLIPNRNADFQALVVIVISLSRRLYFVHAEEFVVKSRPKYNGFTVNADYRHGFTQVFQS